jgi:hypothetical protein
MCRWCPMLKRELIFFAHRPDGSLAGFLFGVPNYAEGPGSTNRDTQDLCEPRKRGRPASGIRVSYHGGGGRIYHTAIHALIHDDNLSALRSATEGAHVFRRYGLFGLRLDA